MKAILTLLLAGSAMLAQTPAPVKTAAKSAAGSLMNPASLRAKAPDLFNVKLTTTKGDVIIEVHRDWAPLGADRFYNLVKNGYYTNASFFRVVPNFVVQFGMAADPAVGKAWYDANFKDDPVIQSNKKGYVVFAKTSAPNSRSTQIFINLNNNAPLDKDGFAPFGVVTEGMNVVEQFYGGYGEAPDQTSILNQGKAYLDKNFPKLDSIKSATVIAPAGGAPAAAPKKGDAKK
jgi:peptidyl-prolyl cis-trans isomerase A (cyclophilin A)